MSAFPPIATTEQTSRHVSNVPILLQKSAATDWGLWPFVKSRGFDALPDAVYATPPLRDAQNLGWWWPRDQRCEPSQVLSDGSKNKLILGASWATQSKSTEPQDALQVCEPHLDLLALTTRLLKALGASERPGNVSGMLVDVARDLA